MIIDFRTLPPRDRYRWMIASVVPRPIAFVSTISNEGQTNLAPFSYFNGVSSDPPVVSIAIGTKAGGVVKDTLRNIEQNGELVINIVSEEIAEPMVLCSGEWPSEQSEFDLSGLTAVPSQLVKPPRVGESPLSLECRLLQVVKVGEPATSLVLASVLMLHVDDEMLVDGLPDPARLRPLARLGGNSYARLGELFEISRPRVK